MWFHSWFGTGLKAFYWTEYSTIGRVNVPKEHSLEWRACTGEDYWTNSNQYPNSYRSEVHRYQVHGMERLHLLIARLKLYVGYRLGRISKDYYLLNTNPKKSWYEYIERNGGKIADDCEFITREDL